MTRETNTSRVLLVSRLADSIRVSYVDGPFSKDVERIAEKYEAGSFDGMNDIYNYDPTPWTETFGDARHVFVNRSYSDELLGQAIAELQAKYPGNDIQGTVEDFRQGRLYRVHPFGGGHDANSLQCYIMRHLEGRDF